MEREKKFYIRKDEEYHNKKGGRTRIIRTNTINTIDKILNKD